MRKNLRNEKASVMPFEETPTVCVCRRTLPHLVAKWSASWVSGLVGYCNFILISIINIDIFSFSIRMEPVLRNNKKNQCKNLKFVATFLRKPHLIIFHLSYCIQIRKASCSQTWLLAARTAWYQNGVPTLFEADKEFFKRKKSAPFLSPCLHC